jgi:hypothetical protein
MGRPRKVVPPSKALITLYELEARWAEFLTKETGRLHKPEFPRELAPAYLSWCKRNWGSWESQERLRRQQMAALELIDTHQIDFYVNAQPIRPY